MVLFNENFHWIIVGRTVRTGTIMMGHEGSYPGLFLKGQNLISKTKMINVLLNIIGKVLLCHALLKLQQ